MTPRVFALLAVLCLPLAAQAQPRARQIERALDHLRQGFGNLFRR
jgi:hypothetical protein